MSNLTKRLLLAAAVSATLGLVSNAAWAADEIEKGVSDKLPGTGISPKAPRLEFFFEARVKMGELTSMGFYDGKERGMLQLVGGSFEGPQIRGQVLPSNRDWPIWYGNGVRLTNVEYIYKTDDGAYLFVKAEGYRYDPAAMKGVLKDSEPNDSNRLRVDIRLQAPDNSPYAWVNYNLFVGVAGTSGADRTATLRVYRVL